MKKFVVTLAVMAMMGGLAIAAGTRAPMTALTDDQLAGLGKLEAVETLSFNDAGVPTFIAGELGRLETGDHAAGALRFLQ
jgi:hypothetical protein